MKTILVIEDEPTVRESLLDLLEAEGFRGIGGENGSAGVKLAQEHRPDLILCDVQMPEMDGYGVLSQLRQADDTAAIPFIFLSAKSTKGDMRRGMELGADDYLTKPCTANELLGAISSRLAKHAAIAERLQPPLAVTDGALGVLDLADNARDGLLNHFYQELRNPLSNINTVIYLLTHLPEGAEQTIRMVREDYPRELAILNQVYGLQHCLIPESADLLRNCRLVDCLESGLDAHNLN
jgi:two-component system, OmpR family, alkaline phosphatase synthesis response regulator PhoP